jgi:Pirin C-terminal cupin domain
VLFDRGDEIVVQAGEEGLRFLLISGQPIEEPVAWYGPIVMNYPRPTQAGHEGTAGRHAYQAPLSRSCELTATRHTSRLPNLLASTALSTPARGELRRR